MIITERALNKSVHPLRRMRGKEIQFPFTWTEERDGIQVECSISNYWDTSNFMVTDLVATCYATLNRDKVEKREPVIINVDTGEHVAPKPIQFTTEDFRRVTGQKNLYRKEITRLVTDTSKIQLKLFYPILFLEEITKGRNKGKQKVKQKYNPFRNAHTLFRVQEDGDLYTVEFHSGLGLAFCHNIQLKGFNKLPDNFYDLPKPAQLVYRKFISHIYKAHPIKLHVENIAALLNLETKDGGMLRHGIVKNALAPLKGNNPPLITSYDYHSLFNERFFNVRI